MSPEAVLVVIAPVLVFFALCLATVARLRRECAKHGEATDGMKRTVAAHIAKSSQMGRQRDQIEAKLADSERQLAECASDLDATKAALADAERRILREIAGHNANYDKLAEERDAEKARADALQTAYNEARAIADKAEREVERKTKECAEWAGIAGHNAGGEELAKAEVERLRGIIGRFVNTLDNDDGTIQHNTLRSIASEADAPSVPVGFPGNKLREADPPPKRHLPADHKCVLCHGTGYYGDNGPGIKGNSEYQPCGCTMREADAPPAKPRRMEGERPAAGAAKQYPV